VLKVYRYCVLLTALVGCSSPPPKEPPAEPAGLAQPAASPPAIRDVEQTAAATENPPLPPESCEFRFPTDSAGQALAKVSLPEVPVVFPVERWAESPLPRAIPAPVADPQPISRMKWTLPAAEAAPGPIRPTWPAPPEQLPILAGLDEVPAKPVLPVSQMKPARAADPNVPPPLPTLARKVADRVPVTDPTNESTTAAIRGGSLRVTVNPSPFFKATIPDPSDYGAHVRPEDVPPAAQPAVIPVILPPQRP
jgi:hypothetical protein